LGHPLYGVKESAPSASLSGTETFSVSLLFSTKPSIKDFALNSVLSAVDVHTFFGALKLGYLMLISTPNEYDSSMPTFVRSSNSSSEIGVCHVLKNASGAALLQSTDVFFNLSVNGSMYSS
jgi:hypothetical protein